jgi:hypothetical protein
MMTVRCGLQGADVVEDGATGASREDDASLQFEPGIEQSCESRRRVALNQCFIEQRLEARDPFEQTGDSKVFLSW